MTLPENWNQLSTDEKFDVRFASFKAAEGIEFGSKEVEEKYKRRAQRLEDIVKLKKPDRVPISIQGGFYPAKYGGITAREAMYDYEKANMAWKKYNEEFDLDYIDSPILAGSGPLFEKLDFKLYTWPGHGTGEDISYQCVEKKYMKDDEYDDFINDPSSYFIRTYLPRIFGALESWNKLAPFTNFVELPFVGSSMIPVGMPDVQESFQKFLEAGQEALKWIQAIGAFTVEIQSTLGLPSTLGGFTKAPFDTLGDTLRGTRDIMLDIYRRPGKIFEAMDILVPLAIEQGVDAANDSNNPFVMIPLHKGADGFLSREQFAEFYWPTLKAVILGLIEEGCVPFLFVEGSYNQRLDFLADSDLPKGKIFWLFDKTDMVNAHKHLTGRAAIGGNVSTSLMSTGTPEEVDEYVKYLIDNVAGDGGFMLSPGASVENAREENIRALIRAGKEYGVY